MKPFVKSGPGHFDQLNRIVDSKKPVHVYKNLNKNCWSIRQCGVVVAHSDYICLRDCEFRVGKCGRERVIKEKKKNVHAYVCGFIVNSKETYKGLLPFTWDVATYNPYKFSTFVDATDHSPITRAKFCDMMTPADDSDELLVYLPV
jgi:hypothetical protein